jgi:hypothetical protein
VAGASAARTRNFKPGSQTTSRGAQTSYTRFPAASRYVIIQYPSTDARNKLWSGGLKDLQDKVGNEYADFRIQSVESVEQK